MTQLHSFTELTTPDGTENVYFENSSNNERRVKSAILRYLVNPPQGFLMNGKLSVTVASNNLTVAVLTLAGATPSSADPVYIRIGDTVRSITSALSVTKNAATNWCNAGSAELATKEIDYFVYLGYNATDGVVIGFSRIPYATKYGDFSATTTAETYAGISNIAHAAATDYYEVVGRFAATLSAGAGYTWSVPTFTAANLINRPIYETRWLTWTPTVTCTGAMTYTSVSYSSCPYKLSLNSAQAYVNYANGTVGGTPSTGIEFSLPISSTAFYMSGVGWCYDGAEMTGMAGNYDSYTKMRIQKYNAAAWNAGATKLVSANLNYPIG